MTRFEPPPEQWHNDTFDVRAALWRVWEAVMAHKLLIVLTTAACLGLVVAYLVVFPPVYTAHVLVMAEEEHDASRDAFYGDWSVFRQNDIPTEAELMTARPVLEQVIHKLDLTYDDVYHPHLRYIGHLWTESWVGSRYQDFKKWLFPSKPSPFAPTPEEEEFARTIIDFDSGVGVQPVPETNAGNLWVRGPSPRVAQIANTMIDAYLAQRQERQIEEARKANEALKTEVARALAQVRTVQKAHAEFLANNDLILLFEKDKLELTALLQIEAGVVEEEAALHGLEQRLAELEAQLANEPETITATRVTARNPLLESMQQHRYQLAASLDQALLQYRPDSPEVQDIRALLEATDERIAATQAQIEQSSTQMVNSTYENLRQEKLSIAASIAATKARLADRRDALAAMRARLQGVPENMRKSYELARRQHILEKKHQLLQEKQMQAEVFLTSAEAAPSPIRVISYAVPPAKASWPNKKILLAAGLLLGICAGTALAVFVDVLRERVTRAGLAQGDSPVLVYATLEPNRRLSVHRAPRLISIVPEAYERTMQTESEQE